MVAKPKRSKTACVGAFCFVRDWCPPDRPRYLSFLLNGDGHGGLDAKAGIAAAVRALAGGHEKAHGRKFRVIVELLPGKVVLPDPDRGT